MGHRDEMLALDQLRVHPSGQEPESGFEMASYMSPLSKSCSVPRILIWSVT